MNQVLQIKTVKEVIESNHICIINHIHMYIEISQEY